MSSTSSSREARLPHIFALVIGINTYASSEYRNLTAAVGDADRFEQYLLKQLNVDPSYIINLRDEKATRAAIISAFHSLRDDVRIIKDDAAIIVYFAGHGARVDKPPEWSDWETAGQQIEMMCPTDMGTEKEGSEILNGLEYIDGIPDRTVAVLLNQLSNVKGDNITLILDCCSSGGINRTEIQTPPGYVPRQIFNPVGISPGCDQQILLHENRAAGTAQGFSGKHHASHVLLAACGRDQVAWENPKTGHGMFTDSLLKILRNYSVNELTYTAVMHKLSMPSWQTPHCEGQHVNRRLFNKKAPGADGSLMLGKKEKGKSETPSLILQAGHAQGITEGSTLGVYASNLTSEYNPELGILMVDEVNTFLSTLSILSETTPGSLKLSTTFYCKIIKQQSENITVYCDDKSWIEAILPLEIRDSMATTVVDDPNIAALHFCINQNRGKVYIERNDPMITPHIGSRLPHVIDICNKTLIHNVILCTKHFKYHLTRTGDEFKNVWMELRKLKCDYSKDFDQTLTPTGENIIEEEPAIIVVDEQARLGMSIFNETDLPLYPYLFYFDPSDLAIIEWYAPPFGAGMGNLTTSVDPPLPPKSRLTIGYGDGGVSPWQFLLRDGEDKDIGFFKLFLTTSPADLSGIAQEPPFEHSISRHGQPVPHKLPVAEKWGSQLATIIQVRKSGK